MSASLTSAEVASWIREGLSELGQLHASREYGRGRIGGDQFSCRFSRASYLASSESGRRQLLITSERFDLAQTIFCSAGSGGSGARQLGTAAGGGIAPPVGSSRPANAPVCDQLDPKQV